MLPEKVDSSSTALPSPWTPRTIECMRLAPAPVALSELEVGPDRAAERRGFDLEAGGAAHRDIDVPECELSS